MKVKKKLFESIKSKYISEMNYSNRESSKYKTLLDKYNQQYGSKDYIFTKYIYYSTMIDMCERFLKDLERLENKL